MSFRDNEKLISNAAPMGQSQDEIVPDAIAINIEGPSTSALPSNNTQSQPPPGAVAQILKSSSHPTILMVHFFFRISAVVLYLFFNFFIDNFVLVFVLSVLFLAFDFWTVKNVSGRYLVGLRWWNEVDAFGNSQWYFEARDASVKANEIDSKFFWISLYVTPIIWIFLALVALFGAKFRWLLIVGFALMLSVSNLVGYHKCDKFAKQKAGQSQGLEASLFGSSGGLVGGFINRSVSSLFG